MEKDFHHHIIYALAKIAGYDKKVAETGETEARIIAYASQYVDDNCDRAYTIKEVDVKLPDRLPVKDQYFYPTLTQAVDITATKLETQKYVFMPFHFLPGQDYKAIRNISGIYNPWCTVRNSENANKLVDNALASKGAYSLYRIGIALHTYADTWAHERFTAFNEPWNKVLDWYKDFKALAPNIGHADVWHMPDQICKTWRDHRFNEDPIDNKNRALEAIEKIYAKLYKKRKKTPWKNIKGNLRAILQLDSSLDASDEKKVYDARKKKIEEFIGEPISYEKDKWITEIIDFEVEETDEYDSFESLSLRDKKRVARNIRLKDDFERFHWYKFQAAAKMQLSEVLEMTATV